MILRELLEICRDRANGQPETYVWEICAGTLGAILRGGKEESESESMKDETNGMESEAYKVFAERMANDGEFRTHTLMMTVSLMIKNIENVEARVESLEAAVAKLAGLEPGNGRTGGEE